MSFARIVKHGVIVRRFTKSGVNKAWFAGCEVRGMRWSYGDLNEESGLGRRHLHVKCVRILQSCPLFPRLKSSRESSCGIEHFGSGRGSARWRAVRRGPFWYGAGVGG